MSVICTITGLLSPAELPAIPAAIPASLLPDDVVLSGAELFAVLSLLPVGSPAFQLSDGAQFQVILFPSDVATIVPCSSVRNTDIPAARRRFSTSA